MVKFYIEYNDQIYVVLEQFEVIDNLNHISKVQSKNQNIMTLISNVELKYVYMKVGVNQYVSSEPNPYEME